MTPKQVLAAVRNSNPDVLAAAPDFSIAGGKIVLGLRNAGQGMSDPARRESLAKPTLVMASAQRESRRRWVQRLQEAFAVREVTGRRALERLMANLKPDVVVVDLTLPGLRRVRGLADMQQLSPSTRIVALTERPTDTEGVLALKAGARGYCTLTIAPRQLEQAVTALQKGEIWASRSLVPGLVAELLSLIDSRAREGLPSNADSRVENLSARQRVIASLICEGACNKEIAKRLHITERTVKAHLTAAFRNVGVSDRLQLALLLKGHHARDDDRRSG